MSVWRLGNDGDVVWPEDVPGLSPGSPGVILGLSPGYPQVIPGLSPGYPLVIPGLSMSYPRVIPGLSLGYPGDILGLLGNPRLTEGILSTPGIYECETSYPEGVRPHILRV